MAVCRCASVGLCGAVYLCIFLSIYLSIYLSMGNARPRIQSLARARVCGSSSVSDSAGVRFKRQMHSFLARPP
jgi:hypothetical protein